MADIRVVPLVARRRIAARALILLVLWAAGVTLNYLITHTG
jgi:hypothetical protein